MPLPFTPSSPVDDAPETPVFGAPRRGWRDRLRPRRTQAGPFPRSAADIQPPQPPPDEENTRPEECRNCGALIVGRYCAECGQEHSHKVISMGRLASEFLEDTFSWDSKLFKTVALLLFRPGFLTNEYNTGRRARYLSPFRLYVFASLALFTLLARVKPGDAIHVNTAIVYLPLTATVGNHRVDLSWKPDAGAKEYVVIQSHAGPNGPEVSTQTVHGTKAARTGLENGVNYRFVVMAGGENGHGAAALEAVPHDGLPTRVIAPPDTALTVSELTQLGNDESKAKTRAKTRRPHLVVGGLPSQGRFARWLDAYTQRKKKALEGMKPSEIAAITSRNSVELAPKGMFVLLPLFALLLKGLYVRRRRLYIEHLVFALHTHAFLFTLGSVLLLVKSPVALAVGLGLAALYIFIAMKVVYRQGWLKTTFKYSILMFWYFILLTLTLTGVGIAGLLIGTPG